MCCDGYELKKNLMDLTYHCEPICQPKCGNGSCVKPNTCKCYYGYEEKHTFFDPVCVPTCNHSCVHGKCIAPDVCACDDGYSLTMDAYTCEPVCNLPCLTGSYCSEPNHCACLNGYTNIIYKTDVRVLNVGKQYDSFDFVEFKFSFFNMVVTTNVNVKSKLCERLYPMLYAS